MEKNIIICITEGVHDAAFLSKIIKINGFRNYKKTLKELPMVIFRLLANPKLIADKKIDVLKVDMANRRLYPHYVLTDDNNLILLYPLLGTDNVHIRKKLINTIDDLIILDNSSAADFSSENTFSILYFMDADDKGIESRIFDIKEELSDFYPKNEISNTFNNESYTKIDNINFGAFIFIKPLSNYGNLEDILVPLMEDNNKDIFKKAEDFLSIHEQTVLFKGKILYDKGKIKKVNSVKFDYNKSLIGTVGQLQKSGMNNTVCITQTDYLNEHKILNNETCIKIMEFIKKKII